ncbi:MAG: hypothetical protein LAP85_05090 [Acidobacteriia bacterium]|nr:hypothetical protein [Terriglobia bacterium]
MEDILAFESVGSGTSLFEGLQERGLDLPLPEKLDEQQSAEKATEVLHALACLRVYLIGFENMTAREFYSTLWNQNTQEGFVFGGFVALRPRSCRPLTSGACRTPL